MKQLLIFSLSVLSVLTVAAQTKKPAPKPVTKVSVPAPMKSLLDSFSYAVGLSIGENMKQQGITNVNGALIQRAINDVFQNKTRLLTHEMGTAKIQEQIAIFQKGKAEEDGKKSAVEKAKGQAYLSANKKRPGVIALPNGLQYEILTPGDPNGIKPLAADTVVVHYVGTTINGDPFDSSIQRGEPATFPVGGVIKGWTEILQMMTKGSKWKVFIPSDLAYGDRGAGSAIAPGATLIFEINLLDIKPAVK